MNNLKAAHFLLIPELLYSPPNNALISAYIENGYAVDIYSPGVLSETTSYGESIQTYRVEYSWLWILRHIINWRWLDYNLISATSEDPLAIIGVVNLIYKTPSISLVDEIKSGSYRGDRSELWKKLCRLSIKRSSIRIVNDESRIGLLRNYANLRDKDHIIVYPGCFIHRPERNRERRLMHRNDWGLPEDAFIIGSSGGFNMTAGADWLLDTVRNNRDLCAVIQPLGVDPLSLYLLRNLEYNDRVFIQEKRMEWNEAWDSAQGFDVGVCVYTNQSPQFQKMGISSNRLCMFIAMGVPVIASRQESFSFLEAYGCGALVEDIHEFKEGIEYIRSNCTRMKENCEECFQSYIKPHLRYMTLKNSIQQISGNRLKNAK